MRTRLALSFVAVVLLLTGCGLNPFARAHFDVDFTPTALGFEVDDQGRIVVASHVVQFNSRPGSLAAWVKGYEIRYLDPSGQPLNDGDSDMISTGAIDVFVPAGWTCSEPDPLWGCTINSPGASPSPQQSQPKGDFITLGARIVQRILEEEPVGARGEVRFRVEDSLGREFFTKPVTISIQYPVAN
jgi:hypothetical protein